MSDEHSGRDGRRPSLRNVVRAPKAKAAVRRPKSKRHGVGARADQFYDPVTGRKRTADDGEERQS